MSDQKKPRNFVVGEHNGVFTLVEIHEIKPVKMEPGVYTPSIHPITGQFLLKRGADYSRVPRLYGTHARSTFANIMDTIDAAERTEAYVNGEQKFSFGGLFVGRHGMGKTQLAQEVCSELMKKGWIAIDIRVANPDKDEHEAFHLIHNAVHFAQNSGHNVAILVDEVDSILSSDEQAQLKSILSTNNDSKGHRAVFFMANDPAKIDPNYFDRPGRFPFVAAYGALPAEIFQEIASDLGKKCNLTPQAISWLALQFTAEQAWNIDTVVGFLNMMEVTHKNALSMLSDHPDEQIQLILNWAATLNQPPIGHLFPTIYLEEVVTYKQTGKDRALTRHSTSKELTKVLKGCDFPTKVGYSTPVEQQVRFRGKVIATYNLPGCDIRAMSGDDVDGDHFETVAFTEENPFALPDGDFVSEMVFRVLWKPGSVTVNTQSNRKVTSLEDVLKHLESKSSSGESSGV